MDDEVFVRKTKLKTATHNITRHLKSRYEVAEFLSSNGCITDLQLRNIRETPKSYDQCIILVDYVNRDDPVCYDTFYKALIVHHEFVLADLLWFEGLGPHPSRFRLPNPLNPRYILSSENPLPPSLIRAPPAHPINRNMAPEQLFQETDTLTVNNILHEAEAEPTYHLNAGNDVGAENTRADEDELSRWRLNRFIQGDVREEGVDDITGGVGMMFTMRSENYVMPQN